MHYTTRDYAEFNILAIKCDPLPRKSIKLYTHLYLRFFHIRAYICFYLARLWRVRKLTQALWANDAT